MKSQEEYLKEYQEERKKRRQERIEKIVEIKKIKPLIYCLSFFAIIILGGYILGRIENNEIRKNKAFTTGQITNHGKRDKGLFILKCTYTVNGKIYKDVYAGGRVLACNYQYFESKYFPVVYSTKNPEKSNILMKPRDFEDWGLAFPDSLKWVDDYSKWGPWDCK